MFSKLLDNPLLSIATTITAVLTILNSLIGSLGINYFWSDIFVSTVILYTIVHWIVHIYKEANNKSKRIGIRKDDKPLRFHERLKIMRYSAVILPVLLTIFAWKANYPLRHIISPEWSLCGTFIFSCENNPCLILFDSRNRKILENCLWLDDDSGFKHFSAPSWWAYRPERVSVQCNNVTYQNKELDRTMFDPLCRGKVEIQ